MKTISFERKFVVEQKVDTTYGEYVKKTATLIQRPYFVTFKLVEKWDPGVMANLHDECITKWRNRGYKSPSMMWWCERKKLSTQKSKKDLT